MLLLEILQRLKQPIPSDRLSSKPVGKGNNRKDVTYLGWTDLIYLLDERAFGCWEWTIISFAPVGDRLAMVGRLTIIGDDARLSRDGTGNEELSLSDYGDPVSNSEAMCLRKAASKFGVGLELLSKKSGSQSDRNLGFNTSPSTRKGELSREEWAARFQN